MSSVCVSYFYSVRVSGHSGCSRTELVPRKKHVDASHSQDYTGKRAVLVASKAQASVYDYISSFPSTPRHDSRL